MITVSGPMFEPAKTRYWESVSGKPGAHYNNYGCRDEDGMAALREMFPDDSSVNEMNLVLFSTSGVHGTYSTIEAEERDWQRGVDDYGDPADPRVTFLIIQPRICCVRHGNCQPQTKQDFEFLKRLRRLSWKAVTTIGRNSESK